MFAKPKMPRLYSMLIAVIAFAIMAEYSLAWPDEVVKAQAMVELPTHPSMIGRFVDNLCSNYLQPLADNVTRNGKEKFEADSFCVELGSKANGTCVGLLVNKCDSIDTKWVKDICTGYFVPWLCS